MEKNNPKNTAPKITRREALKKTGYAAFASSTMLLLLNNPAKVFAATGGTTDPGNGDGDDPFENGFKDAWGNNDKSFGDYGSYDEI